MAIAAGSHGIDFKTTVHRNCSTAYLIAEAIRRGEGELASNGALCCRTGDRTGRSPKDKYLEDTPGIHDTIWWGKVNQPITPELFERAVAIAAEHYEGIEDRYVFEGWAGADPEHRLARDRGQSLGNQVEHRTCNVLAHRRTFP